MSGKIIIVLALLIITFSLAESDVVKLTDDNINDILQKNEVVMIKFYADWCGHCRAFAPEYERTAKLAKQQGKNYVFAELNGPENLKSAGSYNLQGYPTLKLIVKGAEFDFKEDRKADIILSFIEQKLRTPNKEIKTVEELKALKERKGLRVSQIRIINSAFSSGEILELSKHLENMH